MTLRPIRPTMVILAALIALSTYLWWDGAEANRALLDAEREQKQSAESAAGEGVDLADQVIAACERDDPIGQSVREAGLCKSAEDTKETVVDTLDPATPSPSPSAKPVGPSQTQVLTAVSVLLPPAVRDAAFSLLPGNVEAFCALRNGCIGLPGKDAVVTDDRIISLLRPLIPAPVPGRDGIDGLPGAPGRGIVSGPTCQVDGTWSTSFTDGTVETQPGPCRVDVIPAEPEPTPDPTPEVLP